MDEDYEHYLLVSELEAADREWKEAKKRADDLRAELRELGVI